MPIEARREMESTRTDFKNLIFFSFLFLVFGCLGAGLEMRELVLDMEKKSFGNRRETICGVRNVSGGELIPPSVILFFAIDTCDLGIMFLFGSFIVPRMRAATV